MRLIELQSPNGKSLRKVTEPVTNIETQVVPYLRAAFELLQKRKGVGLAATQIGVPYAWFIDILGIPYINPETIQTEGKPSLLVEGCLSLPDKFYNVLRYDAITISFVTLQNEKEKLRFTGFDAQVIQHEIDHLNGVLISDKGDRKYAGE
jgi:peptide deformylase